MSSVELGDVCELLQQEVGSAIRAIFGNLEEQECSDTCPYLDMSRMFESYPTLVFVTGKFRPRVLVESTGFMSPEKMYF